MQGCKNARVTSVTSTTLCANPSNGRISNKLAPSPGAKGAQPGGLKLACGTVKHPEKVCLLL